MGINPVALILAGGRGTRSANPELPKVLQKISEEETLLEQHLSNLEAAGIRRVFFLLGYKSDKVLAAIERMSKSEKFRQIDIRYLIDELSGSTRRAVSDAMTKIQIDEALIVLGDTSIQMPLNLFLDQVSKDKSSATFAVHPNLHSEDSDRLFLDHRGEVVDYGLKGDLALTPPGCISRPITGLIYISDPKKYLDHKTNLDLTRALLESGDEINIHAVTVSGYLKDSGTPTRLDSLREDSKRGARLRRGSDSRAAIFIDRDGTILKDGGTARKSIKPDEIKQELILAIRRCNLAGIPIFLVTNQPGIAKGQISYEDFMETQRALEYTLEQGKAFLDDFAFCPHYPDAGFEFEVKELKIPCICRKPNPGLTSNLAKKHGIDLSRSYVLGDTDADQGLAENSGSMFKLVSWDGKVGEPTEIALMKVVEEIR